MVSRRAFFFALYFLISAILLLSQVGCTKTKTVRTSTKLIDDPRESPKKRKILTSLKRGEYVKFLEEKQFAGKKFSLVELESVGGKGWLKSSDLLDGKLISVLVTKDAPLYERPSLNAPKRTTVRAGQRVFLLEETEPFALIQYPPNHRGYILKSSIGDNQPLVANISLKGIGRASVSASSHHVPSVGKELRYHPNNLFDGNPKSSWCEGNELNDGIGEWVEIRFEEPQSIYSFGFINGLGSSKSSFKRNGRVAEINIHMDGNIEVVSLSGDSFQDTQVKVVPESLMMVELIRFSINDTFKGRGNITCLSEVVFNLKQLDNTEKESVEQKTEQAISAPDDVKSESETE